MKMTEDSVSPRVSSLPNRKLVPVVGLHCSGADGSQWSSLRKRIDRRTRTLAPDLIGTPSRGHFFGDQEFTLAHEARHVIELMDDLGDPANVVGHSYGGALGLHIARARPDLVRSLCLYEPTLFSLLRGGSDSDRSLYREVVSLMDAIRSGVEEEFHEFAAEVFTDFWGGLGTWQALSLNRRLAMISWIEKAPLDFGALCNEETPERIVGQGVPVSILVGSYTHPHTRRIAEMLARQSPHVRVEYVPGAGHLGPFTMRESYERMVVSHIRNVEKSL